MIKSNVNDEIGVDFSWTDLPKSILYFVRGDKKKFIFYSIVLFSVFFYELVPPLIIGMIIDFFTGFKMGQPLNYFYFLAILLGVSHAIASLIRLHSKNVLGIIAIEAKTRAKVEGFKRLMGFPLEWHAKENSGNKIQRIITGSQAIQSWVRIISNDLFSMAAKMIGIFVIFIFLNRIFLVFFFLYLVAFFTIEYFYNKKLRIISEKVNSSNEESSGALVESAGNILAIKSIGIEEGMQSRIKKKENTLKILQMQAMNNGIGKWKAFQILTGVAFSAFLFLIGHEIMNGYITVGSIAVYFAYFNGLREKTGHVADMSVRIVELKSEIGRMMPIFRKFDGFKRGNKEFPEDWDSIRLSAACFTYPSGQKGLKDMELIVRKGEKIGIAGRSGGGKSTLVKILLGLYRLDSGNFQIGYRDFYAISENETVGKVSIVLQENELFNMSLEDNITGMREIDPKLFEIAIKVAGLEKIVNRLPDGLDTIIGENGYRLSGGERQRLGIARALCTDSQIIILDEATSSLDGKTEKLILDGLFHGEYSYLWANKTFIIIAHRIPTLQIADRILVCSEGRIVEEGCYEELIADQNSKLFQLHSSRKNVVKLKNVKA